MLQGGLLPHRPYLILGPSGTGKTTLALQFLCEGVRRGERCLLVTLEEPPNEMRINHRSFDPELARVEVFDAIPDVMRYEHTPFKDIASVRQIVPFGQVTGEIRRTPELTSVEVTITALEQMLRSEIVRKGYSRVVIDSLTALQYFCMKGFDPTSGAQTFLRFITELRATTLLTVESPLEDVDTPERMLARGEIRLFRWELDGVTVRAIGVEKFRGSSHDIHLHPYRIGSRGIDANLAVTISRDTRQIVEPISAVPAQAASPVAASGLGPLSDEVQDLIALGVDVRPLRGEVQAALDAVRKGRPSEAIPHISLASSLTIRLAESVTRGVEVHSVPAGGLSDAVRRLAARADAVRAGIPPTQLPDARTLELQLNQMLGLLPTLGPAAPAPPAAAPLPATAPSPAPVAERPPAPPPAPPAAPGPTGPASVPPAPVPATTVPGPVRGPDSAPRLPTPPAIAPAAVEAPSPEVLVPTPAAPKKRRVAPPAPVRAALPSAPPKTAVPPRTPSVPAKSIPEPAPFPRGHPLPSPSASAPPPVLKRSETGPLPEPAPPPLPRTEIPEIEPTVAPSGPAVELPGPTTAVAPAPPATKRRRKTSAPRKKAAPPAEGPAPEAAAPVPPVALPPPLEPAKPKRRTVRKRKAPPVVAATPMPIPAPEPTTPAPAPAPPPDEPQEGGG